MSTDIIKTLADFDVMKRWRPVEVGGKFPPQFVSLVVQPSSPRVFAYLNEIGSQKTGASCVNEMSKVRRHEHTRNVVPEAYDSPPMCTSVLIDDAHPGPDAVGEPRPVTLNDASRRPASIERNANGPERVRASTGRDIRHYVRRQLVKVYGRADMAHSV